MTPIELNYPEEKISDEDYDEFVQEYNEIDLEKLHEYKNREEYHRILFKLSLVGTILAVALGFLLLNQDVIENPTLVFVGTMIFIMSFQTIDKVPLILNTMASISERDIFLYHISNSIVEYRNDEISNCRDELNEATKYSGCSINWLPTQYLTLVGNFCFKVGNSEKYKTAIEGYFLKITGGVIYYWKLKDESRLNANVEGIPVTLTDKKSPTTQFFIDIVNITRSILINRISFVIISLIGGVLVYYSTGEITLGTSAIAILLTVYTVFR
ncbi:hypothetical protein [Natrinema sp. DC36]|uniref:hypothetical protein n=1 Tax=Natrinema sp. DC36 TaxID=2878680 RepID=UPI001CF0B91A|nr:hypothetical protein [Natrinema sp. DC36]